MTEFPKAAVCAGIKMLLNSAGIDGNGLSRVYLAGGLGKGLNPASAAAIGLLPKELAQKTIAIGNSSLAGARTCAADEDKVKVCSEIAGRVKVLELTGSAEFFDLYTEAMSFGE